MQVYMDNAATTPLDRVLTMIQPRSAFSRELARSTKASLGDRNWERQLDLVVRDAAAIPPQAIQHGFIGRGLH